MDRFPGRSRQRCTTGEEKNQRKAASEVGRRKKRCFEAEIISSNIMFKKLVKCRQQLKKMEEEEEEQEILQTKIISPVEMVKELPLWDPAIKSGMRSLFEEKEGLRILKPGEKEKLGEKCLNLEVVPSKLVITRKACGRRKI